MSVSDGPDGVSLVEYDLFDDVSFVGEFPEDADAEPGWEVESQWRFGRIRFSGEVAMVVRVGVLFGGDFGMSFEELSWRRADGGGKGFGAYQPDLDPNQPQLPGFGRST